MVDPLLVHDDLYELGLVPLCAGWIGREGKRRRCGVETIGPGVFCGAHGGDQLSIMRTVQRQRKLLEDVLLPQATRRVLEILGDDEAKDTDVVRIWSTIMDRVGLAAMQNINLQGEVAVAAPLEILRSMLMGREEPRQIEETVVEGEIIE